MNCNNYDKCIENERSTLKYPLDTQSLYGGRAYDNQTANRRCYERNPIEILEGFGCPSRNTIKTILKWTIILLIIYVIYSIIMDIQKKEIRLNIESAGPTSISPLTVRKF